MSTFEFGATCSEQQYMEYVLYIVSVWWCGVYTLYRILNVTLKDCDFPNE